MTTPLLNNPLFNLSQEGLIAIDSQGCVIAFSPSAQQILGHPANSQNVSAHQLLCALTRESQHDEANCPLVNPHLAIGEVTSANWLKADGHFVSVDYRLLPVAQGDISHIISFIDNSERDYNQAEMAKFTSYIQASPSAIAEFDGYGQLVFGNEAMADLLDKFDFNDFGQARVLPAQLTEICEQIHHEASQENQIRVKKVLSVVDGFFFDWHFQAMRVNNEVIIVGHAFDITAQKLAERHAEEQKNQSRKEFFAKMVHEFRTPLNAIVGFSNILLKRAVDKLNENELKRLQSIKVAGLQLNDLVTDTLDFSKIESGKMTLDISEFAITAVCESIYEQMHTLAAQKGLVYEEVLSTQMQLCSDQKKVRQILINLTSNAIKYTKSGSVTVAADEVVDDTLGECIELSVTDTGIGIPKENIPKLFTSYEQVEGEETRGIEGTGLGLSLVKDLTELLGGRIEVTSALGVGSTFTVWLPYSSQFKAP